MPGEFRAGSSGSGLASINTRNFEEDRNFAEARYSLEIRNSTEARNFGLSAATNQADIVAMPPALQPDQRFRQWRQAMTNFQHR